MTQIVDQLREFISQREYQVGDRLPSERELAARFEVSRPTVHRAVTTLIAHGVLEVRDRSGIYFRGTTALELLAARLALEPWAAGEAARNCSEADQQWLAGLLDEARKQVEDEAHFSAVDRNIHDYLFTIAGNSIMTELYESLRQRIEASRGKTVTRQETRTKSLAELVTLVAAVTEGNAEAAQDAMRSHLERLAQAQTPQTGV